MKELDTREDQEISPEDFTRFSLGQTPNFVRGNDSGLRMKSKADNKSSEMLGDSLECQVKHLWEKILL